MYFTDKLQPRYSDYDRYNRLYPESILKLFEAVAEHHMHSVGDSVVKGDVSWLITDWHIEVTRYPERDEELSAVTWIRRSEKPYTMDRQFVMTAGDEQVIRASLTFTLYDMQRKRLVRISDELLDAYAPEQEGVFDVKPPRLHEPEECLCELPLTIRRADLDFNDHVHNTHYLGYALEALPDEAYGNGEFSSIRVIYHAPLALDTEAVIRVSEIDGGCLCSIRSRDTLHTLIELKNK